VIGVVVKTGDYTLLSTDTANLFVMNSASAHTFTLPGTVPSAGWHVLLQNEGAGTATVARNGHNIDDAATNLSLTTGQGLLIASDGSNYYTSRGMGGGGGGSLASLTDVLISSPANGQVLTYNTGASKWENAAAGGGGAAQSIWTYPKISGAPTNFNPVNSQSMNFTANKVVFMYVHIDVAITVGHFSFLPTTGDATNFYDWGMYDLSGTLIWNLGPQHFTASSGQITTPLAQGTITIQPGNYWLAFTGNGTGLLFWGASPSQVAEYFYFVNSVSGTPLWWTSATSSSGGSLTGLSPTVPSAPTTSGNLSNNQVTAASASSFPVICLSA
jgi:hypothetical protein